MSQQPVYTDNDTIVGDGTEEHPLTGGASSGPGGTNAQLQYNNSGAFGGVAGSSFSGGALTLEIPGAITLISSANNIDLTSSNTITLNGGDGTEIQANGETLINMGSLGTTMGFFGATPIAKPTVTGSRASGAALASLLTELASLGLIIDGSTT